VKIPEWLVRIAAEKKLSPRETEILYARGCGEPLKRIAWQLGISKHTVACHCRHIHLKLQAHSPEQAIFLLAQTHAQD
jgi:DNA-binding NarL/FixJ family response regulator